MEMVILRRGQVRCVDLLGACDWLLDIMFLWFIVYCFSAAQSRELLLIHNILKTDGYNVQCNNFIRKTIKIYHRISCTILLFSIQSERFRIYYPSCVSGIWFRRKMIKKVMNYEIYATCLWFITRKLVSKWFFQLKGSRRAELFKI